MSMPTHHDGPLSFERLMGAVTVLGILGTGLGLVLAETGAGIWLFESALVMLALAFVVWAFIHSAHDPSADWSDTYELGWAIAGLLAIAVTVVGARYWSDHPGSNSLFFSGLLLVAMVLFCGYFFRLLVILWVAPNRSLFLFGLALATSLLFMYAICLGWIGVL